MFGLVGQHWRASHIANGIDAIDIGFAVTVDHHTAAIGLDAELFKAEAFDIALDTNSGDQTVCLNHLCLAVLGFNGGFDRIGTLVDLGDLGFGDDFHALFFQRLAGNAGNFRIFHRHDVRHQFDNRNIATHGIVEGWQIRYRWHRSP